MLPPSIHISRKCGYRHNGLEVLYTGDSDRLDFGRKKANTILDSIPALKQVLEYLSSAQLVRAVVTCCPAYQSSPQEVDVSTG